MKLYGMIITSLLDHTRANNMAERLYSTDTNKSSINGHHFRYRIASSFVEKGDIVFDCACGIGYGSEYFKESYYYGVDKDSSFVEYKKSPNRQFHVHDLVTWIPHFSFDVWVGFETIEHLSGYTNYIKSAKLARKWVILSVPVIPTMQNNEFHLHDFKRGDLAMLMVDDIWEEYQAIQQESEFSEISFFKRR